MSRVGKEPIEIPQNVKIHIDSNRIHVQGPRGELKQTVHHNLEIRLDEGQLTVLRSSDDPLHRSLHGLTRTLIANMVNGVTAGFERRLEISGVGYKAEVQGQAVVFQLGYSHPIIFRLPQGVQVDVEKGTRVLVSGIDKQLVGQVAAKMRSFRPPDPYKEKGIKYEGEHIRRKAGKTAG